MIDCTVCRKVIPIIYCTKFHPGYPIDSFVVKHTSRDFDYRVPKSKNPPRWLPPPTKNIYNHPSLVSRDLVGRFRHLKTLTTNDVGFSSSGFCVASNENTTELIMSTYSNRFSYWWWKKIWPLTPEQVRAFSNGDFFGTLRLTIMLILLYSIWIVWGSTVLSIENYCMSCHFPNNYLSPHLFVVLPGSTVPLVVESIACSNAGRVT